MTIEYKRVNELLDEIGVDEQGKPDFVICGDENSETFKIARAQISGELNYSAKQGAYINKNEHLNKCMAIIKKAKEEFVDLLLFPEYSIPYDIIKNICADKQLWPAKNKLWVLPCCGLSSESFRAKMDEFSNMDNVQVIDYGYEDNGDVEYKYFVNALFYVFVVKCNSSFKLLLLPQLKTFSMKDIDFDCEEVGLSLGSKIFVFGENNGTTLISLLCADVMNPKIDWNKIQKMGANCIVLNPQLNPSPRNKSFSRFRQSFFDGSIEAIMITCNWAADTLANQMMDDGNAYEDMPRKNIGIKLAWSCIYYKKDKDYEFQDWASSNFNLIKSIESENLYAGIIRDFKIEIWYTGNEEIIHILLITKLRIIGPAVKRPKQSIGYVKGYVYNNERLDENSITEYKLLEEKNISPKVYDKFQSLSEDKSAIYAFPFMQNDRCIVDRFFDLVLGKIDWAFLKISELEEVERYTIVLTDSERQLRNKAFSRYLYMVKALEEGKLPEHLKKRFDNAHILYWNINLENHNLYERENSDVKKNGKSIYASYVESEDDAKELLARVRNNKSRHPVEEEDICIIAPSETDIAELIIYPKTNVDITNGEKFFSSTDIAGGDIDE